MNFKNLQRKAKELVDKRGGTDSLKADADELRNIAKGPGSVADKAKRAGDALKDPGAAKHPKRPAGPDSPATSPTTPADAPGRPKPGQPPST